MEYIVAGTVQEYRDYLWEKKRTVGEARYVAGIETLRGIRLGPNDRVVEYGTYYRRKDLAGIQALVADLESRPYCDPIPRLKDYLEKA